MSLKRIKEYRNEEAAQRWVDKQPHPELFMISVDYDRWGSATVYKAVN